MNLLIFFIIFFSEGPELTSSEILLKCAVSLNMNHIIFIADIKIKVIII